MEYKPGESELFDYMEGKLPAEQHAVVKKYLEENADCRSELEAARRGAATLEKIEVSASVDVTAAVMQKINSAPSTTGFLRFVLLAASLLVLVLAGLALRSPDRPVQIPAPAAVPAIPEPEAPAALPKVIAQTPDAGQPAYSETFELAAGETKNVENQKIGTIRLAGPGSFVVSENNVQVARGHARFDIIKRDSDKPFTVSTDDAEIVFIGTSFGVIKELQSTEVVLMQGRLRIEAAGVRHQLESAQTAVISGAACAIATITDQQTAFWSDFPASLNRPVATPEALSDRKVPDTTPDNSEIQDEPAGMSPRDLLEQLKIEPARED